MTSGEQRYEMQWDCSYCGTKNLLAFTHKFCPSCGGAQDPQNRYFPKEGEEVAVNDHAYAGADKICPACRQPNGAKSAHCGGCGAALSGAREAVRHVDDGKTADDRRREKHATANAMHAPPSLPLQPQPGGLKRHWWKLALVVLIIGIAFVAFYRKDSGIRIVKHSWSRVVELETLTEVHEQKDCSEVPSAGRIKDRFSDRRSRQVKDGESCREECSTSRVDKGDGTFSKDRTCRNVCTPKYRTEHYTVQVCRYDIDKWISGRTLREDGNDFAPKWPGFSLASGGGSRGLGKERESKRQGHYVLHFRETEGDRENHTCDLDDETLWREIKDDTSMILAFGIMGSPDCRDFAKKRR